MRRFWLALLAVAACSQEDQALDDCMDAVRSTRARGANGLEAGYPNIMFAITKKPVAP